MKVYIAVAIDDRKDLLYKASCRERLSVNKAGGYLIISIFSATTFNLMNYGTCISYRSFITAFTDPA